MSTGLPGQPGSADPGLSHLFGALTADGHPPELASREAALAMFRESASTRAPRRRGPLRAGLAGFPRAGLTGNPRENPWPGRHALPRRLVTVAVAGGLALGGVTAAAYARALPAPVQQIAYQVFAPLGVPGSTPAPAKRDTGAGNPASAQGSTPAAPGVLVPGASQAPPGPATSPAPAAPGTPAGGYALALTVARASVPAGDYDVFAGRLTRHGKPARGVRVRLLARAAGSPGWRLAATGSTGQRGEVKLVLTRLTTTASFLLAGPDGARSAPVTVTVARRHGIRLQLVPGQGSERLTATAPDGRPGDAVRLAELSGGTWTAVATAPLGPAGTVTFTLPASPGGHFYRAELLRTSAHPAERSGRVWVPRHRTGARVIGTPAPTPDASSASPPPSSVPPSSSSP